jgi:hypothetical protein
LQTNGLGAQRAVIQSAIVCVVGKRAGMRRLRGALQPLIGLGFLEEDRNEVDRPPRILASAAAMAAMLDGPGFGPRARTRPSSLWSRASRRLRQGDIATIVAAMAPDVDWQVIGQTSDFPTFRAAQVPRAVQEFFGLVGNNLTFSEFSPRSSIPSATRCSCSVTTP